MKYLNVAVGVIQSPAGEILIALRDKNSHQAGLWEFPGGKVEPSEALEQALARELKEELNIEIQSFTPLITIKHHYPDLAVHLQVLKVEAFTGEPVGCQGQPIRWVKPDELKNYRFPEANLPIITAARLPDFYPILDDADQTSLREQLGKILAKHKLIQARLKGLSSQELSEFMRYAIDECQKNQASLLINSAIAGVEHGTANGIHLTSKDLLASQQRPPGCAWVAASCHNLAELQHAEKIGVDFVVLGPVLSTPSHPDSPALGWEQFSRLVDQVNLPIYALGGLSQADLPIAQQAGAQGIAGIRAFL